jgi:hypothetical protein
MPVPLTDLSKTWEKAFYFLLLQYRNKHLENFNPEPEQHRVQSGQSGMVRTSGRYLTPQSDADVRLRIKGRLDPPPKRKSPAFRRRSGPPNGDLHVICTLRPKLLARRPNRPPWQQPECMDRGRL